MGALTHVSYLKAFRQYRDTILKEVNTPTYQAILNSFNVALFGKDYTTSQPDNVICGGDGESEDKMEEYRRRLRQGSGTSPGPTSISINAPSPFSLPVISTPEPDPTLASAPAELGAKERPPSPKPKTRPRPKKKVVGSTNPSDPASGDPAPEDPAPENSDHPARGRKKGTSKKGAPTSDRNLRGNQARTN